MSNVLVCGDLILDQYRHLTATRICPEAPVPVYVQTKETYETRGGVGLVQAQLEEFLGVDAVTTVVGSKSRKERLVANGTLIGRIDFDSIEESPDSLEKVTLDKLSEEDFDLLIISDYAKGALTELSANRILKTAKQQDVPVLVDTKNTWDWYWGCWARFPNLTELNEADMAEKISPVHTILKLGPAGCKVNGQYIQPHSVQEVDPTGAGDIFLAAFAARLLEFDPPWSGLILLNCARFANKAAAISVTHQGTYVVKKEEMN